MQLKRLVEYRINFDKPWAQYSAALMGIFIFLRTIWYFAGAASTELAKGELWLHMILPVFLGVVYIGLLRGVQLNYPIVYGVVGTLFCGLMIALNLQYAAGFLVFLTAIFYCLGALVLLATVLGFLTNRLYLLCTFAVLAVMQYFVSDVGNYIVHFSFSQVTMLLREASNLFGAASISVFAASFVGKKKS